MECRLAFEADDPPERSRRRSGAISGFRAPSLPDRIGREHPVGLPGSTACESASSSFRRISGARPRTGARGGHSVSTLPSTAQLHGVEFFQDWRPWNIGQRGFPYSLHFGRADQLGGSTDERSMGNPARIVCESYLECGSGSGTDFLSFAATAPQWGMAQGTWISSESEDCLLLGQGDVEWVSVFSGSSWTLTARPTLASVPSLGPDDAPADDDAISQGGIYTPPWPRKVLMAGVVEFRMHDLPRLEPRIVLDESVLSVIDDD